jgi:hypothetical protein
VLDKHRQIGNAVPVEFSRRLCEAIRKMLDGECADSTSANEQALFDF